MAHTTLINVDIETAPKLALFLSSLKPENERNFFLNETEKMIQESQTFELLTLYLNQTELILQCEEQSDAQGSFEAIVSILYTLNDVNSIQQIVNLFVEKLTNNKTEKTTLRLKILVVLFNLLTLVETKLTLLKAIFQYALTTNQSKLVSHLNSTVERWMTQVSLNLTDKRDIYLLISQIYQQEKKESLSLEYLVKFLDSFPANDLSDEAIQISITAITNAIKSTTISYSHRYLLYKTVSKYTHSNSTLNSLLELLHILVDGSIEGFQAFESKSENSNIMKSNSITSEQILHSLKLLVLCNLASKITLQNSSKKGDSNENDKSTNTTPLNILPYQSIADALHIPEDDVELWVVEAISHKLIEASMDQLNKVVVISRCIRHTFDIDQWIALQQKVTQWKNSIGTLSELLRRRNHN